MNRSNSKHRRQWLRFRRPGNAPTANRLGSLPIYFCFAMSVLFVTNASIAQQDKSLPIVAAGTVVDDANAGRWNRTLLIAKPQISSGEIENLSESIRNAVSKFQLVILATVQQSEGGQQLSFRLAEVGVAYAMMIQNRLVTVTTDTAAKLGAKLDFVNYQMLSQNEKQLATISLISKTETLTIFDTPAILLKEGEHRDLVMRHFIWVDRATGKLGMLVWLLKRDTKGGQLLVAEDRFRFVPANSKEERKIHVDGSEFLIGIPSKRAFALETLPPGKDFKWTTDSQRLAIEPSYSAEKLEQLSQALNGILSGKAKG